MCLNVDDHVYSNRARKSCSRFEYHELTRFKFVSSIKFIFGQFESEFESIITIKVSLEIPRGHIRLIDVFGV